MTDSKKLINQIRDAAFETGYYQATLEKCELSTADREEYNRLNKEAIARRQGLIDVLTVYNAYQFESVPDVEARFASEDATIAELLEVIRSVEWVNYGAPALRCPMCLCHEHNGHGLDCRLAKALEVSK